MIGTPDLDTTYPAPRKWALARRTGTYIQLFTGNQKRTGIWLEPHGNWNVPPGELNRRRQRRGAPTLAALVGLNDTQEQGGPLWRPAPNVPPIATIDLARMGQFDAHPTVHS